MVILGEPYTSPDCAHGLVYSIPQQAASRQRPPAALQHLLDAVAAAYGKQRKDGGDLTDWARQGMLLLPCPLTCREGACQVDAHKAAWDPFVERLVRYMSAQLPGIVFLLLGSRARAKA